MESNSVIEAAVEYGVRQERRKRPLGVMELERDRNGAITNSVLNLGTILSEDCDLQGICFNELSETIELKQDLPWRKISEGGRFWRDADHAQLVHYVESTYCSFNLNYYQIALDRVADDRRFHPVRDYINQLPNWDQTPRAERLLIDYLGAEDSPYVRAVTRKTLAAALRRVYFPGVKFDNILVLCGPQGIGKSTLLSRLGQDWFSDSLTLSDMNYNQDAPEKLRGYWLLEIGEMAGMKKAELEKVKSFLSRQDDKYRESYARRVTNHPRQCVFFGTTNAEDGYLRDLTGNRRFWNVPVNGCGVRKPWELDARTVGQIWAEVFLCFDEEPLYLDHTLEADAKEEQRKALELDEREGLVRDYLDTPLPTDWSSRTLTERLSWFLTPTLSRQGVTSFEPRDTVSNIEIWCECFGRPKQELTRKESNAITAIMTRIDGWERQGTMERCGDYGVQRVYRRCKAEPEANRESEQSGNPAEVIQTPETLSFFAYPCNDVTM